MPGPILFFIFIIVIDLILKSAKDKKNIDEAKRRRTQEINKQPKTLSAPRPMADLRKILAEEIEKEKQRELARRQGETTRQNTLTKTNENKPKISTVDKKVDKKSEIKQISWEIIRDEKDNSEDAKSAVAPIQPKAESNERSLKEDILRGVIFSEILSEPKSLQNQRRSL